MLAKYKNARIYYDEDYRYRGYTARLLKLYTTIKLKPRVLVAFIASIM